MKREFSRSQRMGSLILKTLNELLHFELNDPSLRGINLTSIDLSRDLSIAKIYFSSIQFDKDIHIQKDGLNRANSFLRRKLAASIKVRHVPELRFFYDDSVNRAIEITQMIEKANDKIRDK